MITINNENQLEIYNVVPVYRGNRIIKFLTSVSMSDIYKVYDRLEYDLETQRGMRVEKARNWKRETRIVSKVNIEEMKYKIKNEFFDGATLTWNVRVEHIGEENKVCEFYPLENKIVIKGNKITLPDSAQRHMVIEGLKDFNVSIDHDTFCFPLAISLYTLVEEQALFSEINGEGLKASKTRSLYLSSSYKNILLRQIIKESSLNGNVELNADSIYRKDKVVSFATLYNSLFDKRVGCFKNLQEDDIDKFKVFMIKFYNELLEVRPELQKKTEQERLAIYKESIVNTSPMWVAYATIAKLSMDDSQNWRRKLQRLNSPFRSGMWTGDIMKLENPLWHGTIAIQTPKTGEWKMINNRRSNQFCIEIILKHMNYIGM